MSSGTGLLSSNGGIGNVTGTMHVVLDRNEDTESGSSAFKLPLLQSIHFSSGKLRNNYLVQQQETILPRSSLTITEASRIKVFGQRDIGCEKMFAHASSTRDESALYCCKSSRPLDEQSSAPKAALSYLPPDILPALAKQAGSTPEALSTLTVSRVSDVYTAVTEYVAFGTQHAQLFTECNVASTSSSSDDEDRPRVRRYRNRYRTRNDVKKKRPSVPQFRLALGLSSASWPPPENMKAATLAVAKGNAPCSKPQETRIDGDDMGNTEQKQIVIHIAHYTVGQPEPFKNTAFREMLLASTEDISVLREFAREVCIWHFEKDGEKPDRKDRFILFRYSQRLSDWCSEGWKRARDANTVVLPKGMMEEILEDVESFLTVETRDWYISHGLPPRRCYLFYGPPGTGKTSTIRVIASKFKLTCCFLSMASRHFDNESLGDALRTLPDRALIVVEDVDALFTKERHSVYGNPLTFSGLLNALDGLVSADGVITVLTANNIEKLDKALIRGGRVDRRFLFDKPNEEQIAALFRSFYPKAEARVVEMFCKSVLNRHEEEAKMISTLQQLFIKMRKNSAEECLKGVDEFFEKHIPPEEDLRYIYM